MLWKKNSLAYRLTFRVILFSSLIALCFTLLQLYLDFRQDIRNIHTFFKSIKVTSLRPLEESVWILDDLQVTLQLEGLIKREDIVYASVEMDHRVAWSKGVTTTARTIIQTFPLVHQIRGGNEEIGRLKVVASLDAIYKRMLRRIVILLVTNSMKTFLVSGFILLLFRKNITQYLEQLARHVQQIDIQRREPIPIQLARPSAEADELDQMTLALNELCSSGYQAFCDLRTQEDRLRLFFDATDSAIFGVDAKGNCIFINQLACDYFSIPSQADILGNNLLAILEGNEYGCPIVSPLVEQVRGTIAQSSAQFTDEMPLEMPDGAFASISLRSYPVIERDACTGAIVFFVDISRQQKLEQEKQLFDKIVRQAPALILIVDPGGLVEYANRGFEQIMGINAETLIGNHFMEFFPELDLESRIDQVREKIHNGETWNGTFAPISAAGRRVILDAVIFPILNKHGQLTNVVAMGRDITREQQLVEQLHHAQKMEAMGKLAASIAHEFGNPLLGIRFALRDIQHRAGLSAEDSNLLQLAENECDRMRKLIRDLQQFNRQSSGRKTDFDPHRVLDEILTLHHNLLTKKQVQVVLAYCRNPIRLHAVEDQIRQVFINLIINASDAMVAGGGTLALTTTVVEEELVVAIGDTGTGIAPKHLDHIFEPFFTTKSAVEGTGLGLPVSYGIVRAHGGRIEVDSEPGRTVFRVILPLAVVGVVGQAG
ncbi:MAG: PAS domain S-box protein [Desulfobulbus sp.]|nr:PAS domain S-box protein [Desulfobulbus sp.]